jgi:hypothetical protein
MLLVIDETGFLKQGKASCGVFEVAEPNLLFEFLVVTFDAPAQFGGVDELMERDGRRKR